MITENKIKKLHLNFDRVIEVTTHVQITFDVEHPAFVKFMEDNGLDFDTLDPNNRWIMADLCNLYDINNGDDASFQMVEFWEEVTDESNQNYNFTLVKENQL